MKTISKLTSLHALGAIALAFGAAACSDARANDATQAGLARDLELASATTLALASADVDSALLNSLETQPRGTPEAAPRVKAGSGTRAVRSSAPTVASAPEPVPAMEEEVVEAESRADAGEPVAVAPRPTPVTVADAPPAGDYGTGGTAGGIFGGGIGTGVIIRGGGGDGDNCELHTRGGRRGTSRGPIYAPTVPVARQPAAGGRTGGVFSAPVARDDRRVTTEAAPATTTPRSRPVSRRGE